MMIYFQIKVEHPNHNRHRHQHNPHDHHPHHHYQLVNIIIIYQTEVEQLTVTKDPGDVGEQCSNTWQPLEPIKVMVTLMMITVMMMLKLV